MTDLLIRWREGDQAALEALMPRVYDHLRAQASSYLRRERSDHTLQPTELVNEAFLRLVRQDRVSWESRTHFFAIAARMMRRILVDHARRRSRAKHGAGMDDVTLEESLAWADLRSPQLVALDEALEALAAVAPVQARVVELRYFGGLTREEIGVVLGVSVPTVARHWRAARAWLYRAIQDGGADGR